MTVPGGKIADGAGGAQLVEVLRRDHAADDDHDVVAAERGQLVAQRGHEREMAGGQRRGADDVHVGLDRLLGHLGRRLEQRADVDVEAEVGERRGDHLLAAVVAVLAHLGDHDARPAAVVDDERGRRARGRARRWASFADLAAVHTLDRTDRGGVATEHLLQRVADLADRRLAAGGVDGELQEVLFEAGRPRALDRGRRGVGQALQRGLARGLVALGAQPLELGQLLVAHGGVVDLEHVDRIGRVGAEHVDADHRLAAGVDAGLGAGGRFLDAHLRAGRPRSPPSCRRPPRPPGCAPTRRPRAHR